MNFLQSNKIILYNEDYQNNSFYHKLKTTSCFADLQTGFLDFPVLFVVATSFERSEKRPRRKRIHKAALTDWITYSVAIASIARRASRRRRYFEATLPVGTIRTDAVHLVGLRQSLARVGTHE